MNIQNRHFLSKINGVGYNKPQPEQLNEQAGSMFPSGQMSKVLSELSPMTPKGPFPSPSAKYTSPPETGGPLRYRPPTKGTKFGTSNRRTFDRPLPPLPPILQDLLANWDEGSIDELLAILGNWGNDPQLSTYENRQYSIINKQLTEAMMVLNEKSTIQRLRGSGLTRVGLTQDEHDDIARMRAKETTQQQDPRGNGGH